MMNVFRNNKGLTLVEVLIAMTVLLFVSLALMQTAIVSIDSNMINILRDEAIKIAEMRMEDARSSPSLVSDSSDGNTCEFPACEGATPLGKGPYPVVVTREISNITHENPCAGYRRGFIFGTQRTVTPLTGDNFQVTVLVRWQYKDECYTHTISSILRRE